MLKLDPHKLEMQEQLEMQTLVTHWELEMQELKIQELELHKAELHMFKLTRTSWRCRAGDAKLECLSGVSSWRCTSWRHTGNWRCKKLEVQGSWRYRKWRRIRSQ